jgi:hypothetical protein
MLSHRAKRILGLMPRKKYYEEHKKELSEKQKTRREKQKKDVQKALAELERLAKIEEQKLTVQNIESDTVKKIVRAQIKEDSEEKEKIEGSRPWQ